MAAMTQVKKSGSGNRNAISAKKKPEIAWVATTKFFLVQKISSSGLQRNFNV